MADSVDRDGARADQAGTGHARDEQDSGPEPTDADRLRRLAEDWVTLWQSELSALAADREAREAWRTTLDLWAGFATTIIHAMPRQRETSDDRPARQPRPDAAARPAPAAAAPDPRDAEIERLARHVAELESRLAQLERGGGARRARQRKP